MRNTFSHNNNFGGAMGFFEKFLLYLFIFFNIVNIGFSQKAVTFRHESNYLSDNNDKYKISKQIFDNIIKIIGNDGDKPEFHIIKIGGQKDCKGIGAWICGYPKQEIFIEEKLYDICDSFGEERDNALAFILGHELSHFYKKHWQHYNDSSGKVKWIKQLGIIQFKKPENDIENKWMVDTLCKIETEADYFASFYSYVAGYDPRKIMKTAVESIYNEPEFKIDDNISIASGYLPKSKRITVVDSVAKILSELIPIFDAGNYLLMLKKYEQAALCYDHISLFFPSREIFNNLGLCYALEAIKNDTTPFIYPFEFDPRTRLEEFVVKGWEGLKREVLLDSAMKFFELAIQKDSNYLVAKINKACILDINGEHQKAIDYCNSILKSSFNIDKISICHLNIVIGIALSNLSNDRADTYFHKAKIIDSTYIYLNQNKINVENKDLVKDLKSFEYFNNITASLASYLAQNNNPIKIKNNGELEIFYKDSSLFLGYYINFKTKTGIINKISLALTKKEDLTVQTVKGLRKGQSLKELISIYKQPSYYFMSNNNKFLIYEYPRIIFELEENKIVNWIIYE